MDFLTDMVIAPGEHQIVLHRYLVILVLFLHVPYAGMVLGSMLLSVMINVFHLQNPSENFTRFAREMLDHTVSRKMPVLVLGVLPLLSLLLLNVQWFAGIRAPLLDYMGGAVVLIILGFILSAAFRHGFTGGGSFFGRSASPPHIICGAAGAGLLCIGYFFLLGSISLFSHPGKWAFIEGPPDVIFTWNSIWRFAQFIMLSLALAGIGILFFFFQWPGKNVDANTTYGRLAKYFAAGTALGACLMVPLISFFLHVTSPIVAMSVRVYAVWTAVLVLLAIACLYLVAILQTGRVRYGTHVFVVFLIMMLCLIASDQLAMENATREHTIQLVEKAEAVRAEREETRRLATAKEILGPGEGKKLYEARCSACHEFDRKLVGPPHREVLPKYKDDLDGLVAYLRNPTKKDPNYPPMPNLGLSESEARAIAQYLFEEIINEE